MEIALFVLAPVILLSQDKTGTNPLYLYWACCLVVMGFVANRLNVFDHWAAGPVPRIYCVPKWTEFALAVATITAAVLAFRYAVYLEILPKFPQRPRVDGDKRRGGCITS